MPKIVTGADVPAPSAPADSDAHVVRATGTIEMSDGRTYRFDMVGDHESTAELEQERLTAEQDDGRMVVRLLTGRQHLTLRLRNVLPTPTATTRPVCHYGQRGMTACGAEYPSLLASPQISGVTCPDCLRLAPSNEVHALRRHPDFEYATTQGPRKAWADPDTPPVGPDELTPDTSWEQNVDVGDRGWERFEFYEESYWRRRRQS